MDIEIIGKDNSWIDLIIWQMIKHKKETKISQILPKENYICNEPFFANTRQLLNLNCDRNFAKKKHEMTKSC